MNRKQEQADLIYQLGLLLAPLQDIVDNPNQHNEKIRARAVASFAHDSDKYLNLIAKFVDGEPGHSYDFHRNRIVDAVHPLRAHVAESKDSESLRGLIDECKQKVFRHLLAIPTDIGSEMLEANAPFSAYRKLKAYFETTNRLVYWADPYMGPSLFHRYLNYLPDSVAVTLVTMERPSNSEYVAFVDVSRLCASERGPTK